MARPRRPTLTPRLAEFRAGRRLTQEQVAEAVGITVEMVRRHEQGHAQPVERYRRRYSALYGATQVELGLVVAKAAAAAAPITVAATIDDLIAEISESGATHDTLDQLGAATASLAELHTQAPARLVLRQVLQLRARTHEVLVGRIRLSQARELYRIEADLLAHACLLMGDLKQDALAYKFGSAALMFATEAGTSPAIARSALAKTLRWQERLPESADMARAGYELSPMAPVRVQLASQEANAAALLGDAGRAREALRRAERDAEICAPGSGLSAWSFSRGRQAIFALSVATHTGDPDGALRAAALADSSWAAGEPMVKANWAQIRVGAALAHIDRGDLDAAIDNVMPVLDIPPEFRVATVTAYTDNLARRLNDPRLLRTRAVTALRSQIREFSSAALPGKE